VPGRSSVPAGQYSEERLTISPAFVERALDPRVLPVGLATSTRMPQSFLGWDQRALREMAAGKRTALAALMLSRNGARILPIRKVASERR
jgi:hypothetical protein